MSKEKKHFEDRLNEITSSLGDEEEKVKQLSKLKNKYEAIIADLEERLKREQQVRHNLPFSEGSAIGGGMDLGPIFVTTACFHDALNVNLPFTASRFALCSYVRSWSGSGGSWRRS